MGAKSLRLLDDQKQMRKKGMWRRRRRYYIEVPQGRRWEQVVPNHEGGCEAGYAAPLGFHLCAMSRLSQTSSLGDGFAL